MVTTQNGTAATEIGQQEVQISPPTFQTVEFTLIGTAPYVQHRFSQKAREQIRATQSAGSTAKSQKQRTARDFEADFVAAQHRSVEGWPGIPASSFRNGMISACRVAGFVMTRAKLAVFIEADGIDDEGLGLVRINGEPRQHETYVRNETGVIDLRARPMWDAGWTATLRVRFDASTLTVTDVANLLARVGEQVGIGEGRPDSKKSNGMGWGLFRLE